MMDIVSIGIEDLKEYIYSAFIGDDEIIEIYDPNVNVRSIEDVCESVYEKIESLVAPCKINGVLIDEKKVGYFAYSNNMLISFGFNKEYRSKEWLIEYWETIKSTIGCDFQCALFSVNKRAINWLKKQGMSVLFENITILTYEN